MALHLRAVHLAARLREAQRKERTRDHLRRVCLGRRHADLGARLDVERTVGLAGGGGPEHVGDREDLAPHAPHAPGGGKRVGRLAGLRDDDAERVGRHDDVPLVVELRRVVADDGHLRPRLDQRAGDEAHVIGRAAGNQVDQVDRRELLARHGELVQEDALLA